MSQPDTFTGRTATVEWYRVTPNTALAGMQPKHGAMRIAGSGRIVNLSVLQGDEPGVYVEGLGDVPLSAVKTCDGQPVGQSELVSWFMSELGAWCLRHRGSFPYGMPSSAAALIAYAKSLR